MHTPELGVEAVAASRVNLDSDPNSSLLSELDQLLARKPVVRPLTSVAKPANSNRQSVDAAALEDAGFTWQPDIELDDETQAAAAETATASAASAAWLQKARQDKRGKARRNAAAWTATVFFGSCVLVASAYLLTGWTLDFDALKQVAANWSTAK